MIDTITATNWKSFFRAFSYTVLFFCLPQLLPAQLAVSLIPDSLLKDANAVIRQSDEIIMMKSDRKSEITVDRTITIINRNADDLTTIFVPHDKFFTAKEISGEIYDAAGNLVRKLKNNEIEDIVPDDGSSFVNDSRAYVATLKHDRYPYTVHIRYILGQNGLFGFPAWMPQDDENVSVEKARLEIITAEGQDFRYKVVNMPEKPYIVEDKGSTHYLWQVNSLPAIETEPMGPPWREYVPVVYLAPTSFEIQGYKGKNQSWSDFGMFFHTLNAGRDKLPEELEKKVIALTEKLPTKEAKVQAIYRYLQENTRYVGIQLGIGGWQTFDAEYVYNNGYGDCKALSNYAKSMLSAVGINSHAVLIKAGDFTSDILPDFSSSQFNHVILCVPNEQDTIWMDCTMNNHPAGYLGMFTEDRYALVVTPEGGKLTRTPSSPPESNQQQRKASVSLDKKGNAVVKVVVTSTGYQQDNLAQGIVTLSEGEKEKWIRNSISAKSFELTGFKFDGAIASELPTYRYSYDLNAVNWATASGTRFFLAPNQLERYSNLPEKVESRTQPVVSKYPYWDTDTIEYQLPEGFVIESMPEMPLHVESDFGVYEANIDFQPEVGKLIYTRSLLMHKTRKPAESYEPYRDFIRNIIKADKIQVVLSGKS
ncbi:MAG: DUF3857 and transglutaminase domain-containing protein [Bacteroidia bacterium]